MAQGTVVLAGAFPGPVALGGVVSDYGWSFATAADVGELERLNSERWIVAVLFSPRDLALAWDHALRSVQKAVPGAFPILCHRVGDLIDWPQAAGAGAFHALLLPFAEREVRQSLGFVWSVRVGSADHAKNALVRRVIGVSGASVERFQEPPPPARFHASSGKLGNMAHARFAIAS